MDVDAIVLSMDFVQTDVYLQGENWTIGIHGIEKRARLFNVQL